MTNEPVDPASVDDPARPDEPSGPASQPGHPDVPAPRDDSARHDDPLTPQDGTSADLAPEGASPTDDSPTDDSAAGGVPAGRSLLEQPLLDEPQPDEAVSDEPRPTDSRGEGSAADGGHAEPSQPGPAYPPAGSAGFPPPGGYVPPPPGTSGYATRFGLVRPTQGRYVAGVCGALGRATNTDPVFWRVMLPVLMLIGGLGALLYIIGWLVIPSEGDSGSPVEALAGRGWSSTSRTLTIVLACIAVLAIFNGPAHIGGGSFVAVVVIGGIVLLATSRNNTPGSWPTVSRSRSGFTVNWPAAGTRPPAPPTGGARPTPIQTAGAPGQPTSAGPESTSGAFGEPPVPGRPEQPQDDATAYPMVEPWTPLPATAPLAPPASAYQPPFAPYGPYEPATAYSPESGGFEPAAPVPPPPKLRRRRSPMRRITISAALLVVGLLAVFDASNIASVPASVYFAAPLATIGAGLVIGSFFGRMRGPITLGVLITFCLLISSAVSMNRGDLVSRNNTFRPATIADLRDSYTQKFGSITLDLSRIDFTDTTRSVDITLTAGHIDVILPPTVDASVIAKVGVGHSQVFDHDRDGVNAGTLRVTDDGSDGPGGGSLQLDTHLTVGEVEVSR